MTSTTGPRRQKKAVERLGGEEDYTSPRGGRAIITPMLNLKQNWTLITGLGCAALAAAYTGLRLGAALPPDGGAVVYPLTLLYNYSALPASIVVVLAAFTVLFVWVPQAIVRGPHFQRDGALAFLALAAAGVAIWAALPLGRLIYRELGSAAAAGRTYHLGGRVSADPAENAYVVCQCAPPDVICHCQYLYDASLATLQPLPELSVGDDQRVTVRVEGRLLYVAAP